MQSERQWDVEAVAMLLIGLCISMAAGIVASAALRDAFPNLRPVDKSLLSFAVSTVFLHVAAIVLVHTFIKHHGVSWGELIYGPGNHWRKALFFGLVGGALIVPVAQALKQVSEILLSYVNGDTSPQPAIQMLQVAMPWPQRICYGFSTIVVVPLAEEAVFRGVAYRAIRERGYPNIALVVSSVLFGLIHINSAVLVPLIFFGVVMAILYEKTGALLTPIVAHSVFNAINFSYFIFSSK